MELDHLCPFSGNGLYTSDIARHFKTSPAKAWRVMRALEIQGIVSGEARHVDTGDEVERRADGKPATIGAEIRWWASVDATLTIEAVVAAFG